MALRTYGECLFHNDSWVLNGLDPHVCLKLKTIFPFIRKGQTNPFIFPDREEICRDLLWFMDRYPLRITHENLVKIHASRDRYNKNQDEMEQIFTPNFKHLPVKLNEGFELREYQKQFVSLFDRSKTMLLGDDVGVGKSAQAIGSILSGKKRPALIVVNTHLVEQWKREIEKFSDLKVCTFDSRKPFSLPEADVYVTKYVTLQYWIDVLLKMNFVSIYFDEVQELRRSESEKYKVAKLIAKGCEFRCGMTATPIYNYADEIWNIYEIIRPGMLGAYWDFQREWCADGSWVKDPKALGSYLRDQNAFIRRTAKDVGRELPPVNTIVHTVDYDEKSVIEFKDLAKSLAMKVSTGTFMERGQAARELDIMIRQSTGISKAKYVAEYVKILLKNGEPVLLAGWHRQVYDIWLNELAEFYPVMYTGSESESKKNEAKKMFIDGDTNLMIISLRSGIGLDGLQHKCKYVVVGELDWTPQIHHQLIGRLWRDGQKEQVTAIYLVSEYGSDPLIIDLNGMKASHANQIVNPFGGVEEKISDESRIKLLAERILKGS